MTNRVGVVTGFLNADKQLAFFRASFSALGSQETIFSPNKYLP
jgi:hypothetical protein